MEEVIRFPAPDGYALEGTLFTPEAPARGAVLLAPALAVPRRLYVGLAAFLAEQGLAALAFDYRGIGGSRPPKLRGFDARFHQWGELDLEGALGLLAARFPGAPLLALGHSAGAQLLGLAPRAQSLRRLLIVGAGTACLRHWSGLARVGMALHFRISIPLLTRALGYLPMSWARQGEDVPAGVAREWAGWARHPDYVLSYARGRGLDASYRALPAEISLWSIADDAYAPRAASEHLLSIYGRSPEVIREVRPSDVGAHAIGHFGFFRPRFRETLWREAADWLAEAGTGENQTKH